MQDGRKKKWGGGKKIAARTGERSTKTLETRGVTRQKDSSNKQKKGIQKKTPIPATPTGYGENTGKKEGKKVRHETT